MKRYFDILLSLTLSLGLILPILLIAVLVKLTSAGPALYWSDRVGKGNRLFRMPKFRTMHINTPVVATHLLFNADSYLTPIGSFLRKSSLDELPQIYSILRGEMSFVGPRPALFNQKDLIELRTTNGIDKLTPGITGWAQINGRDTLSIEEKVNLDFEYLTNYSFKLDLKILWLTLMKVAQRDNIAH